MLVSQGPAAYLGSRSLSTIGICPYTGLRIPLVPRGLRSTLLELAYIEPRQNVSNRDFIFFREKLKYVM